MTFCHLVLKLNTFHVCICNYVCVVVSVRMSNYVCVVVSVCISNYVCVVVSVCEYICEREGESCLMQTECKHLFSAERIINYSEAADGLEVWTGILQLLRKSSYHFSRHTSDPTGLTSTFS